MSELLTPAPAILWKRKWLYLVNLKKITECQILKTEKKTFYLFFTGELLTCHKQMMF